MLSIPNPMQLTANKPKPKWSRPPPGVLKINTDGAYEGVSTRAFYLFRVFSFSRCNNSSAHELARLGFGWDLGQSHVWTGPLPICVNTHVTRELAESVGHNTRP
jgi:hypothetical protein